MDSPLLGTGVLLWIVGVGYSGPGPGTQCEGKGASDRRGGGLPHPPPQPHTSLSCKFRDVASGQEKAFRVGARGQRKGQAEAAMLGIARVLVEVNADFRPALKAAGLLKRDPRSVERKKFGKKKARRSFQFSKR